MKKVVITAIGTLMLSSVLLLSVGCGGRLVSTPLYGKTVTFTGKTMPVDWDGQTGAGYADGESETPVGDLIEKYFEEIDWDYTAECDNYEILANLTEADKASPDAFMAYIDTVVQERGIYAGLEGATVTVGSKSDEVEVVFSAVTVGSKSDEVEVVFSAPDGKEYRYTCTDTSPGRDGTVLSSEMLSGENWSGNASFATSWNGVREYFSIVVPDVAPPMGISLPVSVILYDYESDGAGGGSGTSLVEIRILAETTIE